MEKQNLNNGSQPALQQTDVMRWVAVSERLPEIDTSDKWNNDNKITKDVLCWSKEWGMRFGRYFYSAGFWTINGVTSSNGVTVEYWMDVKPPMEETSKNNETAQLGIGAVMRSLLLKYQEEWKKAKANSKRTTKGGYEKVDLKEWGKMEAFAMIMDDLARLQ